MKYFIYLLIFLFVFVGCGPDKVEQKDKQPEQKKEEKSEQKKQEEVDKSKPLFERLGGEEAVKDTVQVFYGKVLKDDRVKEFFGNTDMTRQIRKQTEFLTMVFGGPSKYTGQDLRVAHAHLVQMGLDDKHFDAIVELLGETLKERGATEGDIAEVVKIAESVRKDVLNK